MEQNKLEQLQKEIEVAQAELANLRAFTSWDWSAYKVEGRAKDAVIRAMSAGVVALRKEAIMMKFHLEEECKEEEVHESTELCN